MKTERKRINRAAICSSANYEASRRAHRNALEENHKCFLALVDSGVITIPEVCVEPNPETIVLGRVFGKYIEMPYRMAKSNNLIWKRI